MTGHWRRAATGVHGLIAGACDVRRRRARYPEERKGTIPKDRGVIENIVEMRVHQG